MTDNYRIIQVDKGDPHWDEMRKWSPQTFGYMDDPADGGVYYFFAAIDKSDKVLGMAVIDISPMRFGPLADKIAGFLENIEVAPEYRQKSIGKKLLQRCLEFAWQKNAQHVRWTVSWDNKAAMGLYLSCGAAMIPENSNGDEKYYTAVVTPDIN